MEEEEEEEEEEEDGGGEPSSKTGEPELNRVERRELKKKQAKATEGADDEDEDEDELLVNPNHVSKKLNISDLSAPRQLTRRERCVPHTLCFSR